MESLDERVCLQTILRRILSLPYSCFFLDSELLLGRREFREYFRFSRVAKTIPTQSTLPSTLPSTLTSTNNGNLADNGETVKTMIIKLTIGLIGPVLLLLLIAASTSTSPSPSPDFEGSSSPRYHPFDNPFPSLLTHPHHINSSFKATVRSKLRGMLRFAYTSYLDNAYPRDELNPLTCRASAACPHIDPSMTNDICGEYLLTLVDSLDTLLITEETDLFIDAFHQTSNLNWDSPYRVQLFEVNIRILGSLLSTHLLLTSPKLPYAATVGRILDYANNPRLLRLAHGLGKKLMLAFSPSSPLPYSRLSMLSGVLRGETPLINTASAGTLMLEFKTLSLLTKDESFETAAKTALAALLSRRSQHDLLGMQINLTSLRWTEAFTGLGAGLDSAYEYLLKSEILFGGDTVLNSTHGDWFATVYHALKRHLKSNPYIYRNSHIYSLVTTNSWIDSLSAFFPGLMALYGDVKDAMYLQQTFMHLFERYQGLPERWDYMKREAIWDHWPLRPEVVESAYALYRVRFAFDSSESKPPKLTWDIQATKNQHYLHFSLLFIHVLETHAKTSCGYAIIHHLQGNPSHTKGDRMESFFLSETLKYLWLLWDEGMFFEKYASQYE